MNSNHQEKRLLILVGSPRRNGNSAALAAAAQRGADAAGTATTLLFLDDYIQGFLPDLRHGSAPADRYSELFRAPLACKVPASRPMNSWASGRMGR